MRPSLERIARIGLLLLVLLVAGCSSSSDGDEAEPEPEPIGAPGLIADLRALEAIAQRNGGDRAAGTPGYAASADYVARELREAGWRVELRPVPLRVPDQARPPVLRVGSRGALRPIRDFRTLTLSGAGAGSGALRVADDGCSDADFAGLRPGEVALARRAGCFNFVKARGAARAGAAALLVADESHGRGVPSATLVFPARLPVLAVSGAVAARARPGDRVTFRVDASVARATTTNVIAERGDGERVVMAGAHLDSVPAGPGINDNGSGVATLLAVARSWDARGPSRVRLAFWGGEEVGLVGSRHYVEDLAPDERRQIAAYLNLDMVGSPNAVPAVYDDADAQLERLLRSVHPGSEKGVSVEGSSDHAAFQEAGIRVGGLYTGSEEAGRDGRPRDPCYHLPCDDVDNVDRDVLLAMAHATARAIRRLSR